MIRARNKNKWEIRIDNGRDPATGKRLQGYHSFKGTKREAQAEERRLLALRDKRQYVKPAQVTFSEWSSEWLAHHKQAGWTPRTAQGYEDILKLHINPELGSLRLDQITPLHVQNLITKKLGSEKANGKGRLSTQTVLHIYRVIGQVFAYAKRLQVLAANPCECLKAPKVERKEAKALTEEEIQTLLKNVAGTRLYLPVKVALGTGVRRGELLALTWKNVDLKNGVIHVTQALSETRAGIQFKTPKNGKPRAIYIPSHLAQELARYRKEQQQTRLRLGPAYRDQDLVFPAFDGSPWKPSLLSGAFANAAKKTDITGLTFHTLRHTSISQLLMKGIPLKVVSARAGHKTIAITADIYGHLLPGGDEKAAEVLDSLLITVAAAA